MRAMQLWLLLIVYIALPVAANDDKSPAVTLGEQPTLALFPYLTYWLASDSDLQSAQQAFADNKFIKPSKATTPVSNQTIWYHVDIEVTADQAASLLLNFNEMNYDVIEIHYFNGQQWVDYRTGNDFPYSSRPLDYRLYAFPLDFKTVGTYPLYFKIHNSNATVVYPLLQNSSTFAQTIWKHTAVVVLVIGIQIGIFCYFLLVPGISLGFQAIRYFLLFILSSLTFQAYHEGLLFFLIPDFWQIHSGVLLCAAALVNVSMLLFCSYLFGFDKDKPRLHKTLLGFSLLFIPIVGSALFTSVPNAFSIMSKTSQLALPLLLGLTIYATITRVKTAGICLLGVVIYIAALAHNIFGYIGYFEITLWTRNLGAFGVTALTISFAMALSKLIYSFKMEQAELTQRATIAEAKNNAKTAFLATMSHEIRTPINGLMGMAQILDRTHLDRSQKYYLDILINSGKSLLHVINDILDLSKIESGKLSLEEASFDLDQLIASSGSVYETLAQEKNLVFDHYIEPNVPTLLIGDQTRLQQIFNNLLSNAFKFTNAGYIYFHCELINMENDTVNLRFSIKDSGKGISIEAQQHIFDAYTQEDESTTREYGGTGLGLSICKHIAKLMDGDIGVISAPGKGTEMWFTAQIGIDTEKTAQLLGTLSALRNKHIGLLFMHQPTAAHLSKHFSHWQASSQCIADDVSSVDFSSFDLIISSKTFIHALIALNKPLPPILLLVNDEFKTTALNIYALSSPAGFSLVLQTAAKLISGRISDLIATHQRQEIELPQLHGMHILIADDNMVNRQVLDALIRKLAIQADFARNGEEAVNLYQENHGDYQLIFMDCEMPILDGYQATTQIRRWEAAQQLTPITIIALTAHAMQEHRKQCLAAGMNDILTKPIDFEVVIKRLVGHYQQQRVV